MFHNGSTAAFRLPVTSTLAAVALTAAFSQGCFAGPSDAGIWRVDPAKSRVSSGYTTLAIERAGGANSAPGKFIVISNQRVYLVMGPMAHAGTGTTPADYASMVRDGNAVLIGTRARTKEGCGFRCRSGLPEPKLTVTFRTAGGVQQHIEQMLAYDAQEQ
jgi:hypothetical protein